MSGEKTDLGRMLGIIGSSRRGGNTETLVDEVLRGAEEAGALVEKVILSELDIAPCRACDTCRRTGSCVQQDDMPAVMEQMRRSSVWVLGTPVYWWGPTAQFKAFLARWYVGGDVISRREGQRVIVVIPLGDTDAGTARHVVGMFEDVLAYLKMELLATVLAPSTLPSPVFIAVGSNSIYAFQYSPRGFAYKIKKQVARWPKDEVSVEIEKTRTMAKFTLTTASGESHALEVATIMGAEALVDLFLEALGG